MKMFGFKKWKLSFFANMLTQRWLHCARISFTRTNWNSRVTPVVVGAAPEGGSCQRSSPRFCWTSLSKDIPAVIFPPCVPATCLEKDSLRHAGSLTEFSCIQEKKIQASQPLKSWRRIYTDTQDGHICESHILVWGADRGESLETWKLVAQMQTLRWQKKVSRKYCLVIQLLKILSCHPTFENIVTSSNFLQLPGNSVSDRLRPLRYITQHSLSKYQDGDQALLRKPFFILLLVTLSPSELWTQISSTGISVCLKSRT